MIEDNVLRCFYNLLFVNLVTDSSDITLDLFDKHETIIFPCKLKATFIRPLYNKGPKLKIENDMPISVICFIAKIIDKKIKT